MGCYLTPGDALAIESVVTSIDQHPRRTKLLVAGNFNADLAGPEVSNRDEDIATLLALVVLEDILEHFIPHQLPRDRNGRTWIVV